MRLDRNEPELYLPHRRVAGEFGIGKYAVINLRKANLVKGEKEHTEILDALDVLGKHGLLLEDGKNMKDEFFVIKLCDSNARVALIAYAGMARIHDMEYAADILELADRAGPLSRWCKNPD